MFVPFLRHRSPAVRSRVVAVLGQRVAVALHELLPLLGDPDDDVRAAVVCALPALGAAAVDALRAIRRAPAPDRHSRRTALTALAQVGGAAALDDTDRMVVERLIRVKQAHEMPEPMHLCSTWFAVPTADQAAVLNALDLSDPVPVTMRLGAAAWNADHHAWDHEHGGCARVYVSPTLEGWTLAFGRPVPSHDAGEDAVRGHAAATAVALSRRFGAAHWYGMSCGDGWTAWCIAVEGTVVAESDGRFDDDLDDDDEAPPGPTVPWPEPIIVVAGQLPLFDVAAATGSDPSVPTPDPVIRSRLAAQLIEQCAVLMEEGRTAGYLAASTVAGRLSVDPGSIGPGTRHEGHGVLALTACGRKHGVPPAALEI
ncbi:HEAT repeat domain-containing protein [Dactylosporangium sp. NPDC006015]|uniref:HEAT repeat domain-containing protein n=1 Tax=Dactylosporangium sp. NPDC006015 TaxID=3154576 RepID=UPI0033B59D5C